MAAMAPVLGDVRRNRREIRHLMATRRADRITRVQAAGTLSAQVRHMIDHVVHPVCRHQRSPMSAMSRLAARPAVTLPPTTTDALAACESVRGGRLRRRGVLVPQRQLSFEIGNLLLRLGELPLAFGQFTTQALVLSFQPLFGVRVALPSLGLRHALHGTPIKSVCTA